MRMDADYKAANTGSGFDDDMIIRQSSLKEDIPYKFRTLYPIVPFSRVFYPATITDSDGNTKDGYKVLKMPIDFSVMGWTKQATVVDQIVELDLSLQQQMAMGQQKTDVKSSFSARNMWALPVFDRRDATPTVRYLEVSWQVYSAIVKLQEKPFEDDTSFLKHGPIWAADIVVTKQEKKKKGKKSAFNIEYVVDSAQNNVCAGKLPISINQNDANGTAVQKLEALFAVSVEKNIFTQEEFDAIDAFEESKMFKYYQPHTPVEILEILHKNPIRLDATDYLNRPIFTNPAMYMEALSRINISSSVAEDGSMDPHPAGTNVQQAQAKLPEPEKNAHVQSGAPAKASEAQAEPAQAKEVPTGEVKGDVPDYLRDL